MMSLRLVVLSESHLHRPRRHSAFDFFSSFILTIFWHKWLLLAAESSTPCKPRLTIVFFLCPTDKSNLLSGSSGVLPTMLIAESFGYINA